VGISTILIALETGSRKEKLAHVADVRISGESRYIAVIADGTTMYARGPCWQDTQPNCQECVKLVRK